MGRETYPSWYRRTRWEAMMREFFAQPAVAREDATAARLVELWNARRARGADPLFAPTIGAALRAGRPILSYLCPGCHTIGTVDLRKIDIHPDATVQALIQPLSRCSRCEPGSPFVKLLRLG